MLFFSEFPRANTLLTLRNPQLKQHFTVSQLSGKNISILQHTASLKQKKDNCEIIVTIIRH